MGSRSRQYTPTWPIFCTRIGLAEGSVIAQRPFVVNGIVIPAHVRERLRRPGELAAQPEHGAHAVEVERRLAREAAMHRMEQLVVAARRAFGRDVGKLPPEYFDRFGAVGRIIEPIDRCHVSAYVTNQ